MMSKRNREVRSSTNYLERIPLRAKHLKWSTDENEKITLEIYNKGIVNKITQLLLKKPKISYVHLDEMGSFLWPKLDGQKTLMELGEEVKKQFGQEAEPLYERLAKYFQILDSYGFIEWKMPEE